MLRRKLMLFLTILLVLGVTTAGVMLWLLEDVLKDLRGIDINAATAGITPIIEKFRWLVLGLGVTFLVVINLAAVVLLRAATLVLRPIDRLLRGSRHWARERFDYRVRIEGESEFNELAQAFNSLARRLEESEKRKVETIGQIGCTLNHELNNAMTIIELKLRPLARQASGNAALEESLRQIRQNLDRMARTVESLKHVRRIVLTDYVAGVKMLDLERSLQEDPPVGQRSPSRN